MRIATYNVENLFDRPKAMNLADWNAGRQILTDFQELNDLINEPVYTPAIKSAIKSKMQSYTGLWTQGASKYIRLREIREKLVRTIGGVRQVAVNGRLDWVGWFELETEQVKEVAVDNTARVIGLVGADVLAVIEAEDRKGLERFSEDVLPRVQVAPYEHAMVIDGNDERGIDVGVLCRGGFSIGNIRSHVDDADGNGVIFSRDCPEFEVSTPSGATLLVMVNHFKSKGYGTAADSNAKRRRQADRVRAIYDARIAGGYQHVAVVGDFNDTPSSAPLAGLLAGSGLVDVMAHAAFQGDGRDGTFGNGAASSKIDYLLMSPALAALATDGGIERQGVWGGVHGTLFPHLPTMASAKDSASDHAALWVDVNL